jgi:hypothetical protein
MKKSGMNDKTLVTVNCSMCRLPMDCDKSLLLSDQHFCPKCDRRMDEGYEIEDFVRDPEILARLYGYSQELSQEIADVIFQEHWKKVPEKEKENEALAKEFFCHGAALAMGFLICGGMPPWYLDEMEEQIRAAREIRKGEGEGK